MARKDLGGECKKVKKEKVKEGINQIDEIAGVKEKADG